MGNCNCLFINQKPIRIMKTDGKILEYKSPTRVFQDGVPVTHHLNGTAKLLSSHLYFLIPKEPEEKKPKKAVRFAEPEKESGGGGVVRIKVVMTKKELQEMVGRGGISAEEMICKIKSGGGEISCRELDQEEDEESELQKWKPVLQSIPESEVAC